MIWETWVQSLVVSYQRLQKWYLIPPCLNLSIIRYVSRVKWSNPGNGVAPSPTPWCCSYWKGSLLVALDYSHQQQPTHLVKQCTTTTKILPKTARTPTTAWTALVTWHKYYKLAHTEILENFWLNRVFRSTSNNS